MERKAVIGSVEEFKTAADAQTTADALRLSINEQTPRQQLRQISLASPTGFEPVLPP